jgi:oxygen-independent coproporphyrinogen-3 oxidase
VCPYCDFAVTIAGPARRASFVDALLHEAGRVDWTAGSFDTVYLGGGTPSSLELAQLERIVGGVRRVLPVRADARITLEANPEDVTAERLAAWREAGVTAVSLGVQSFRDAELAFLGRRHEARDARRALAQLVDSDFEWVSADLIFGLPGQTAGQWRDGLDVAIASGVDHLSCYQLTIHEGTVFGRRAARGRLREAPDDAQSELFGVADRRLEEAGWDHYEVSNWAVSPGARSRHNRKYWRHVPYLGLGPSAHSFDGDRRRWWNIRSVRRWQNALVEGRSTIDGSETLTDDELLLETVLLALRTSDGIDLEVVRRRFGFNLMSSNRRLLDRLRADAMVVCEGDRVRPTARGMAVADAIVRSLDLRLDRTKAEPSS